MAKPRITGDTCCSMRGSWVLVFAAACSFNPRTADIEGPPDDAALDPDSMVVTDTATDTTIGPWLAGFSFRKPVTITRTTGSETLASFPVAVIIDSDAAIAQHALASGADLVVTSDDGATRLDSQLVGYDGSTGKTELWVRIPQLATGTTSLFLYYGATAQSTNPGGVWPSQFRAVWHLSETAGSSASDSAGTHTLDQGTAEAIPGHEAGIAGLGRSHDGDNDLIFLADPADGSLDFGASSFSYSIWVNANANIGQFDQPIYKGGTSSSFPGYTMMLGTGGWAGKLHDGNNFRDVNLSATPTLNVWHHLAIVIDRGTATARGYFDGVESANIPFPIGSIDSGEQVRIGRGSGGAQFSGLTDEAHIAAGVLSADWIATEHANLTVDNFVVIGAEQAE